MDYFRLSKDLQCDISIYFDSPYPLAMFSISPEDLCPFIFIKTKCLYRMSYVDSFLFAKTRQFTARSFYD